MTDKEKVKQMEGQRQADRAAAEEEWANLSDDQKRIRLINRRHLEQKMDSGVPRA